MNKVAGIGIAVVVIAVVIVAAMSFSSDPATTADSTTITQVGPFMVESGQEISQEETDVGTDYSVLLTEKIGVKSP